MGFVSGTNYLRPNSSEATIAIKNFSVGFKIERANLNGPKLTLVMRNIYVMDESWEVQVEVNSNEITFDLLAKWVAPKINGVSMICKVGASFSGKLIPRVQNPLPVLNPQIKWEKYWKEALDNGVVLTGVVALVAIAALTALLEFAAAIFLFIFIDPIKLRIQEDLPMAVKWDVAEHEQENS